MYFTLNLSQIEGLTVTVLQTGKIITSLSEVNLIPPSAGKHLDFIKVLAIFSFPYAESHSLTTTVESMMVTIHRLQQKLPAR